MLTRERIVEIIENKVGIDVFDYGLRAKLENTEEAADAILAEMDEPKPNIICLAASKHYRLRPAMTAKAWIISLVEIGNRAGKFVAKGETYWDAEAKARAYLAGLPEVGK